MMINSKSSARARSSDSARSMYSPTFCSSFSAQPSIEMLGGLNGPSSADRRLTATGHRSHRLSTSRRDARRVAITKHGDREPLDRATTRMLTCGDLKQPSLDAGRLDVVYDGQCAFCIRVLRCIAWLARRD